MSTSTPEIPLPQSTPVSCTFQNVSFSFSPLIQKRLVDDRFHVRVMNQMRPSPFFHSSTYDDAFTIFYLFFFETDWFFCFYVNLWKQFLRLTNYRIRKKRYASVIKSDTTFYGDSTKYRSINWTNKILLEKLRKVHFKFQKLVSQTLIYIIEISNSLFTARIFSFYRIIL